MQACGLALFVALSRRAGILDPARRSVLQLCVQKAGGPSSRFHPLAMVIVSFEPLGLHLAGTTLFLELFRISESYTVVSLLARMTTFFHAACI